MQQIDYFSVPAADVTSMAARLNVSEDSVRSIASEVLRLHPLVTAFHAALAEVKASHEAEVASLRSTIAREHDAKAEYPLPSVLGFGGKLSPAEAAGDFVPETPISKASVSRVLFGSQEEKKAEKIFSEGGGVDKKGTARRIFRVVGGAVVLDAVLEVDSEQTNKAKVEAVLDADIVKLNKLAEAVKGATGASLVEAYTRFWQELINRLKNWGRTSCSRGNFVMDKLSVAAKTALEIQGDSIGVEDLFSHAVAKTNERMARVKVEELLVHFCRISRKGGESTIDLWTRLIDAAHVPLMLRILGPEFVLHYAALPECLSSAWCSSNLQIFALIKAEAAQAKSVDRLLAYLRRDILEDLKMVERVPSAASIAAGLVASVGHDLAHADVQPSEQAVAAVVVTRRKCSHCKGDHDVLLCEKHKCSICGVFKPGHSKAACPKRELPFSDI